MSSIKINITRLSKEFADIPLPAYSTPGAAGMDIYAAIKKDITIKAGQTVLIPTDFSVELPSGFEAQIRPRSGLALKNNIGLMNSPGTIDPDYRGEVKIIVTNHGSDDFTVHRGDRIAQMVIARFERAEWVMVESLSASERGNGGFGSTGVSTSK